MLNLGDITKINGAEHPIPSVVIGGSPCQDLSVAGKRAGLAGERSGLFMEQIRVIKEMRSVGRTDDDGHILPRWMVWENVPGALSSQGGEDFRAVLEETCRVADETAVIPRPPKGKWTAAGAVVGNGYSVAWRIHDAQYWGVPQRRRRIALVADFGARTAPELLFGTLHAESESMPGDTDESGAKRQEAARGVIQGAGEADRGHSVVVLEGNGSRPSHRGDGYAEADVSYTLNSVEHHAVAYGESVVYDARGNGNGDTVPTVTGDHENRITDYTAIVLSSHTELSIVRRLTPRECERLQGYPDDYTNVGDWIDSDGKTHPCTDSLRYRALGNSIALPFWQFLLNRIAAECKEKTMVSLFDGIGGFPLCWQRAGGETLWVSEIEDFCIAVTKKRFGEEETK